MRINAPSARPTLAGNDLDVVLQSARLQALVLPKVEQAADVAFVAERAAAANNTYVARGAGNADDAGRRLRSCSLSRARAPCCTCRRSSPSRAHCLPSARARYTWPPCCLPARTTVPRRACGGSRPGAVCCTRGRTWQWWPRRTTSRRLTWCVLTTRTKSTWTRSAPRAPSSAWTASRRSTRRSSRPSGVPSPRHRTTSPRRRRSSPHTRRAPGSRTAAPLHCTMAGAT